MLSVVAVCVRLSHMATIMSIGPPIKCFLLSGVIFAGTYISIQGLDLAVSHRFTHQTITPWKDDILQKHQY